MSHPDNSWGRKPGARALQSDAVSGFLVFLIALPLCLAIANASKYPPIMGIWTAVIGGVVCTLLSNSQLTIKGPAAGMIVIVAGAVLEFKADLMAMNPGLPEEVAMHEAYRMTLGVGVASGIVQILLGLFRAGILADLLPISAVHGLLASIGVIIMCKQGYSVLGLTAPDGEAIHSLLELPAAVPNLVPSIAAIGLPCLLILIGWSYVTNKTLKKIPGPVVVLLYAVPMGLILGLTPLESPYLVKISSPLEDVSKAFFFPNFDGLLTWTGLQALVLFAMIGSLESLLSAKAVDLLDPMKRKTNLNRDILAVGVANTAASLVGGLPMISEIVRSSANISNGAKTKYSNLFHSLFLLLAVLFLAPALARIPLSALGAMLVFTGYRLAHPREFRRAFKIGAEQLAIFITTIVVVLFTDLLIGIAAGCAVKLVSLTMRRLSPVSIVKLDTSTRTLPDGSVVVFLRGPLVFLNWVRLANRFDEVDAKRVILDVSRATFIDHTAVERIHELELEFHNADRHLTVEGLELLTPVGSHNLSARKRSQITEPKAEQAGSRFGGRPEAASAVDGPEDFETAAIPQPARSR